MESKQNLFEAMAQAQIELRNPVRNKLGFNYSYSTLDSIIEQTKPILAKYGLVVIQLLSGDGTKVGITTILAHSSGESVQETLWLPSVEMKSTNAVQAMGASISYGRRYSLTSVLGISSEEDTDASDDIEKKESTTPDPARFTAPKTNGFKKPEFVTPTGGSTGTYPNPNIPSNTPVVHIAPVPQTVVPTQVTPVTTQAVAPVVTVPTVAPSAPVATAAPRPSFATPKRPTFAKPNFKTHIENLNKGGQQ